MPNFYTVLIECIEDAKQGKQQQLNYGQLLISCQDVIGDDVEVSVRLNKFDETIVFFAEVCLNDVACRIIKTTENVYGVNRCSRPDEGFISGVYNNWDDMIQKVASILA